MKEDDQDHTEITEYWHGWYWYRFLLGHAMLSNVVQTMEDYQEAESIGDLPEDVSERLCELLDTAIRQKDIIGHMGCDFTTSYR